MNFEELLKKAERAAEPAQLLFEDGDFDGSYNRAYYAMFDAARAALSSLSTEISSEAIKTHSGLISAFSMLFVKTGLIDLQLGKTLNKAEDLRLIADYTGDPIDQEHAEWVVAQALN